MTITLPDSLLVPAEGMHNLREVGGYRAGTAAVRRGKLYRSDALHRLTPAGRATVEGTGIRLVVDLRSDDEVAADPTVLGAEVTIVREPIFTADAQPVAIAEVTLGTVYDHMIDDRGAQLTAAVRRIARSGETAVLVHCTAGKDRTGVVVALALLAAGVDKDVVVADYAQTASHLRGEWSERMLERMRASGAPASPELIEIVTASPAAEMARLIDRWDTEWGSAAAYLREHGLSDDDLAALEAALIDNDSAR